jgi:hypothetical protein
MITKMMITCIKDLNEYFNKNKKGKNTTKKEKLDLCNNINDGSVKKSLDFLIENIYNYRLFEIDMDDFLINKSKYVGDKKNTSETEINDQCIKDSITKIDLRVFKRLLNIFTFDDSHKLFKSHIETSIQYKILQRLVIDFKSEPKVVQNSIESLTINLNEIWNLS